MAPPTPSGSEPPLLINDAFKLTQPGTWISRDALCHGHRDILPLMVWATQALSQHPSGAAFGDRPPSFPRDAKLEEDGEPLRYLRDIFAPCTLREHFLFFTQREKTNPA